MAQQLINVGTVANDRTGDTWRAAFQKVNSNETELFDFKDASAFIFVAKESDFPVQDATTITLEASDVYVISESFTTTKKVTCEDGSVLTMFNASGPVLTYSGSGNMFTGVDANFTIKDARISCASATTFNFQDTIGNTKIFLCDNVVIESSLKAGTFDSMLQSEFLNVAFFNTTNGINLIGTNILAFTLTRLAIISTSATIIHIDLGTATVQNPEFDNLVIVGPAGAVGVSGLVSSGNVPVGSLGAITNSSFAGGMTTPLQNIDADSIRWLLRDNTPAENTFPDGLLSLTANATNTVISAINTPTLVAGTWVVEDTSQFTGTTAGRLTYLGERNIAAPISVVADFEPVSGTNKDLKLYIALNGTVITPTGRLARVDSGNPQSLASIWQLELSQNDFIEVFVENTSDAIDILVSGAVLRVR